MTYIEPVPNYEFSYCKYKEDGPVATFTWSDPTTRNAYNVKSWEGFTQAVERVRNNDDLRVLVITGDPEGKTFCGGLNVKWRLGTQLKGAGKEEESKQKEAVFESQKYLADPDQLTPGTPQYESRVVRHAGDTEWWSALYSVREEPEENLPPGWTQGRMRYEKWRRRGKGAVPYALLELDKPVIAMVNGGAYGAGVDIAFCCDIIIASEEQAKFEWTYIRRGLIAEAGATYFLPRICGRHIALELLWLGKGISARQAYEWGLINHVVPDAELEAYTYNLARELAESPPMIMGVIKDVVHKGYNDFFSGLVDHHEYLMGVGNMIYRGSEDELEGSRAFVEKRKPVYKFR